MAKLVKDMTDIEFETYCETAFTNIKKTLPIDLVACVILCEKGGHRFVFKTNIEVGSASNLLNSIASECQLLSIEKLIEEKLSHIH